MAVVFITRVEGSEPVNEGLCIQCAKEMGIKPVNDLVQKMGLSDEELENMNNQLMDMAQAEGEEGLSSVEHSRSLFYRTCSAVPRRTPCSQRTGKPEKG
jgi:hypothetical protein